MARAVDGVSFTIAPGETLGLVGESGCGKSVTALSVMRLLPRERPRGRRCGALRRPATCCRCREAEMRDIRGNRIAMIFQEPMTSLNPVHTIGEQIAEAVRIHEGAGRAAAMARARGDAAPGAHSRCATAGCATIRISSPAACASAR